MLIICYAGHLRGGEHSGLAVGKQPPSGPWCRRERPIAARRRTIGGRVSMPLPTPVGKRFHAAGGVDRCI